ACAGSSVHRTASSGASRARPSADGLRLMQWQVRNNEMKRFRIRTLAGLALAGGALACGSHAVAQSADEFCTQEEADTNADCRSAALAARKAAEHKSAEQSAPFDVTGYWASVVTEDWRWRVVTPPKGDVASIPLNHEGLRVANTWDPAQAA